MRVGLLAASGVYAALLEENFDAHPEANVKVVWSVGEPGSVLAALDHEPDVYLLDMHWREEALTAGQALREAGLKRIICLFDRLEDTLVPTARQMGFEVFLRGSPLGALLERLNHERRA